MLSNFENVIEASFGLRTSDYARFRQTEQHGFKDRICFSKSDTFNTVTIENNKLHSCLSISHSMLVFSSNLIVCLFKNSVLTVYLHTDRPLAGLFMVQSMSFSNSMACSRYDFIKDNAWFSKSNTSYAFNIGNNKTNYLSFHLMCHVFF